MNYILITSKGIEVEFKSLKEANEFAINLIKKGYKFTIQKVVKNEI